MSLATLKAHLIADEETLAAIHYYVSEFGTEELFLNKGVPEEMVSKALEGLEAACALLKTLKFDSYADYQAQLKELPF
jgi:hypothetical protein